MNSTIAKCKKLFKNKLQLQDFETPDRVNRVRVVDDGSEGSLYTVHVGGGGCGMWLMQINNDVA